MPHIRYLAVPLPAAVMLYFLDRGLAMPLDSGAFGGISAVVEGHLAADTMLSLAVVGLLCLVFAGVIGWMFGDWATRATARFGGLRCGVYLGETFSGVRYYADGSLSSGRVLQFKTGGAGSPDVQSFRHLFRRHLLDDEGLRLERREAGLHSAVETLIIRLLTLWLVFIFAGLALLPSLIFQVAGGPGVMGALFATQNPYLEQVLLPAMPGLAIGLVATLALGIAALWRRQRFLRRFETAIANAHSKPLIQSGEILEGRVVERVQIDPDWYHAPHVGYCLEFAERFDPAVVLGFSLPARPDCPIFRSLERAAAAHSVVRVWVDPQARIHPLTEPLAEAGE